MSLALTKDGIFLVELAQIPKWVDVFGTKGIFYTHKKKKKKKKTKWVSVFRIKKAGSDPRREFLSKQQFGSLRRHRFCRERDRDRGRKNTGV
jgi:hypothetical protein